MEQVGVLQSVQVGTLHHYAGDGTKQGLQRSWETSFFRQPSAEPRWLAVTHLAGNAQADTHNHGRPDQAVLLYAAAHYPHWQAELGQPAMGAGGFGENFTVAGLAEDTACIGDIYTLGDAQIQVTGPRYPCWKIERRHQIAGLTDRVAATGRTGWYCRVVQAGMIAPGLPIWLSERPYPQWTVALTNDFGHGRNKDVATATALAACPLLVDFWQQLIVKAVRKQ